jgi:hypothetical protein
MTVFVIWIVAWTVVLGLAMAGARRLSAGGKKKSTSDICTESFFAALIPIYSVWIATHLGKEEPDPQRYTLIGRRPSSQRDSALRLIRALFWVYPSIVLVLGVVFAFGVGRESPSQTSAAVPAAPAPPAKRRETSAFEQAAPSLGRLNLSPSGLTLVRLNKILHSEGKKIEGFERPWPCVASFYATCPGNSVWFSWYNQAVVAGFFEPTFRPDTSEVYQLSIRMPELDVYDTADDVPRAYRNLCLLSACLSNEDWSAGGFWRSCGAAQKQGTSCGAKWYGSVKSAVVKNKTRVVDGHLVYFGGPITGLTVWNNRDYYSLPGH